MVPYVRLSIVKPRRGEEQHVDDLLRKITDAASSSEGCLASYLLTSTDGSGDRARVAVYATEQAAEAAANSQHILSLRSELHLAVEPGHIERAFVDL
jgi:quinol monooxygenase YgiN